MSSLHSTLVEIFNYEFGATLQVGLWAKIRDKDIAESTLGYVKANMQIEQPAQCAGGLLASLWKGNGSHADICNCRDVAIVSTDTKQFAAHTRTGMLEPLRNLVGHEVWILT